MVIESTRLPGTIHRDPADQLLVATARILEISLFTRDAKLLAYPHVSKVVIDPKPLIGSL